MDSVNSLANFFYNLVPGVVFILILRSIVNFPLPYEENLLIAIIAVLGLFLGFVFQGFTRFTKNRFLYRDRIFQEIKCGDIKTFRKAKIILMGRNLINSNEDTHTGCVLSRHIRIIRVKGV